MPRPLLRALATVFFEEAFVHFVESGAICHVGQVDGQVHDAVHRAAGSFQCIFQGPQGAFALLGDAAQLQAAVRMGRDLGADQHAVEVGDVRGDGVRIGIGGEDGGVSRNRRKFRRKTSEASFSAGSSTRHGFTYTFYPWKGAIFALGAAASEIICFTTTYTNAGLVLPDGGSCTIACPISTYVIMWECVILEVTP